MLDLKDRLEGLTSAGWSIPLPGQGQTPERHRVLAEWGRADLSMARIGEAHTDAVAILAEAQRRPQAAALYGVWASDGPQSRLRAVALKGGEWRLEGTKQYCSGASLVTASLVTAHSEEGLLLFDIAMSQRGLQLQPSTWQSSALADTVTGPMHFDRVIAAPEQVIGAPNWYLQRPGFWHGALGPAACWAGGAMSLADAANALNRRDPHSRAQLGALQAAVWGLAAFLAQAGREIDADPADLRAQARVRALKVRHLIERTCVDVLDRFGRASGPQLLAYDAQVARQYAALTLYIRQCHAERDLETIPA